MSVIGVIAADLEESDIRTRSRLGEPLCGEPVLRRTVSRALGAKGLKSLHVVTRPSQRARVEELVAGLDVIVETHDAPAPVWREMAIAGRKWALHGWRGGIGGACAMDEGFHPAVVGALAEREGAIGAACIPAAAAVIDPELLGRMIGEFVGGGDDTRIVFAQAPPGLCGVIWDTKVLNDLGGAGHPPGWLLSYQPDEPSHDLVVSNCCFKVPAEVTHTAGRFLADTRRGMELLEALLSQNGAEPGGGTTEAICRWQRDRRNGETESLPREVEIELTTADQLGESVLRPRGGAVGERGPIRVEMVQGVVEELSGYDDSLVVLGGFGEPLLHPEFERILRICREGAFGLAVRTNGIGMTPEVIEQLVGAEVDVISMTLDATTPATYRAVHGCDGFEKVQSHVEALFAARDRGERGLPLIVPEMVKVAETMPEMEGFFDDWIRRAGWANIEPFNTGAGRRADRSVMPMAPPRRVACGRLWSRCVVLGDGGVVRCDQDYTGAEPLGNVGEKSMADIWGGSLVCSVRSAHRAGRWKEAGLCESCCEWHRP